MQIKCVFFFVADQLLQSVCKHSLWCLSTSAHEGLKRIQRLLTAEDQPFLQFPLSFQQVELGRPGVAQRMGRVGPAAFCSSWANRGIQPLIVSSLVSLSVSCGHVQLRGALIVPLSCVSYRSWNRYRFSYFMQHCLCYINYSPANRRNLP